jgi:HSP20 family protein
MALPPRDAIDKILFFQQEVNRIFKGIFGEDPNAIAPHIGLRVPVPVDIAEKEDIIIYEIAIPGVDIADIKLHVSSDIIVVEGVKKGVGEGEKGNYLCVERNLGTFRRLLEIPMPVDSRNVDAVYMDGVLRVVLEKISDRRGLKREVEIKGPNEPKEG